ncbi:MAG: hypothetical protein RBU37_22425 [Myxococcota bacterium]|jgi:hypothetical protein|nr:hypothetical protein [Myxococcota bacterium]
MPATRHLLPFILLFLSACQAQEQRDEVDEVPASDAVDQSSEEQAAKDAEELSPSDEPWLPSLHSNRDWAELAAGSEELKYLIVIDPAQWPAGFPARCAFQNMHLFPWHLNFLKSFKEMATMNLSEYLALVVNAATRQLWGGNVYWEPARAHPISQQLGIYPFTLYGEERPYSITPDHIIEAFEALSACAPELASSLVFKASGQAQAQLLQQHRDALAEAGVASIFD